MTAPVSQVLSEAADLLQPEGAWIQGSFCGDLCGRDSNCFCAVGAIGQVIGSGRWPGSTKAEGWVDRHWPIEGETAEDLEDWNDTPGRTQAEVVAKLREAAALAKEQGR